MKISASVKSKFNHHETVVQTDDEVKVMQISPLTSGSGTSVNGAELLLLSLATGFCNDLYREATMRNLQITGVEVEFNGEFGTDGIPATHLNYKANVLSESPASEIEKLIHYTDHIAEINNILKKGVSITLTS